MLAELVKLGTFQALSCSYTTPQTRRSSTCIHLSAISLSLSLSCRSFHFAAIPKCPLHASSITRSSLDMSTPSAFIVDLIGVFGRASGTRYPSYGVPRASRFSQSQLVTCLFRIPQIGGLRSSAYFPISMGVRSTAAQDLEINSPRS